MSSLRVRAVCFSPTRTTRRVVQAVAEGCSASSPELIDMTHPAAGAPPSFGADDLVIFGAPVYGGRVAPLALARFLPLVGNGAAAAAVVLYGNRAYEDALRELGDFAAAAGFRLVAGAAFIGEHSLANPLTPIAAGRPDGDDLAVAMEFGRAVLDKVARARGDGMLAAPVLPGNVPYRESMGGLPFRPEIDRPLCTLCGDCVAGCPARAMTIGDTLEIDGEACILCCACIRGCSQKALSIVAQPLVARRQWLYEQCRERKAPELFL